MVGRSLCACGLWSCPCIVHPTYQVAPATGDQRASHEPAWWTRLLQPCMPCRHAANDRQPTKLGHSTAQLLHCTLSPAARYSSQHQPSPSPTPSFLSISISPSCRLSLSEATSSRPSRPENKHPNSDLGRTSYIAPYRLNLALTQHTLVSSRNDLRLPFHPSLPGTTRSPLFTACRWFARATKFGRKYLRLHCISPDRPTLELER